MLTTVEGVYRNGKVELSEAVEKLRSFKENTRVIVTFLPSQSVIQELLSIAKKNLAEIERDPTSLVTDEELERQIAQKIVGSALK